MRIDRRKCVACGNCLAVCPVSAIAIDRTIRRATVDLDECVECYACHNRMSKEHLNPTLVRAIRGFLKPLRIHFDPEPDVCPTSAFAPEEMAWPRSIRRAFSDPCVPHESTGIYGRGTEEVKTNDVTNRVGPGAVGLTVEFGRPAVGARFREVQAVTMALARIGAVFERQNPVTALMPDPTTGAINPEVLEEKVLSAIVEVKTPQAMLPVVLRAVKEVAATLETVVSAGVSVRCDGEGENPVEAALASEGYAVFRGKTNLGLGRLTNLEAQAEPVATRA
jgi:ferredoxin